MRKVDWIIFGLIVTVFAYSWYGKYVWDQWAQRTIVNMEIDVQDIQQTLRIEQGNINRLRNSIEMMQKGLVDANENMAGHYNSLNYRLNRIENPEAYLYMVDDYED